MDLPDDNGSFLPLSGSDKKHYAVFRHQAMLETTVVWRTGPGHCN